MAQDTPAGVVDPAKRWPALARAGLFSGYPINMVGGAREEMTAEASILATLSPLIRYGIEISVSNLLGPHGLRPQPIISPRMLGISETEADDLVEQLEEEFISWANSPSSSATGAGNFHAEVEAALRRAYETGEMLFSFDWRGGPGASWYTTAKAVETQRITRYSGDTGNGLAAGHRIMQGIELDPRGKPVAVYIGKRQPAAGFQQGEAYMMHGDRYPVATPHGRPLLALSILDRKGPGVTRGISPIAAAVVRALQLDKLTDLSIETQAAQLAVAWSIITDANPAEAASSVDGERDPKAEIEGRLDELNTFFAAMPLRMPAGAQVSVLPTGSKLEATTPKATPTLGYDAFQKRLLIELARGFAMSYDEFTGDYSSTSYSASKKADEGPWSIVYRRRNRFVAPIYAAAYECVIEEAVQRGLIKLPRAISFYHVKELLLACRWVGPTRPILDPLKEANANDIELANGSSSLAHIAAERGQDWRDTIDQRAREIAYAKKKGVDINPAKNSAIEPTSTDQEAD